MSSLLPERLCVLFGGVGLYPKVLCLNPEVVRYYLYVMCSISISNGVYFESKTSEKKNSLFDKD